MVPNGYQQKTTENTQFMSETFEEIRALLDRIKDAVDVLGSQPGIPASGIQLFREAIFCCELGITYYDEANRAIQAQAWFAGSAVAAAALEAVLMAKCLFEHEEIRTLPKWKQLQKVHKDKFDVFVRSLDLGKLLEIAELMNWFPAGGLPTQFEKMLSAQLDAGTMQTIRDLFQKQANAGQVCAMHVREYRNLLHPSVCLKENHLPTPAAGMTATFLFLIAFSALAEPRYVQSPA